MGFLDKLFGKKDAGSSLPGIGGGTSLAGALAQQNEKLVPQTCDKCSATYLSSEAGVFILSVRAPDMRLDIGGYCRRCRKHICQRHVGFDKVEPSELPNPEKIRDMCYGVVCETCGTPVRHDKNADPARFITIISLDAKDLETPRPKPSAEFAGPSGRFSLYKILLATLGSEDALPKMICMKCFAFHPHPVPAPMLGFDAFRKMGYDVSPEDFEVDVGADCSQCGAICGKHITLKMVKVQGADCLALFCSTHGDQLS